MGHPYARIFLNQEITAKFLSDVLGLHPKKVKDVIPKIVKAEKQLAIESENQTLSSKADRDVSYHDDDRRWELRRRIIEELFTLPRLNYDENLILGTGGALPQSGIKAEKKAFIIIGLPASGKSAITVNICEKYGAIIIDSDYAKRKLPEYHYFDDGASIVHLESDAIVNGFGSDNPEELLSVYELSFLNGYNMVMPRVGYNISTLISFSKALAEKGYEIHLILTSLNRKEATIRAIDRLDRTGRYVPLGLIFDAYGNDPILNYYLLRAKYPDLFSSFTAISTLSSPASCIDVLGTTPCSEYEYDGSKIF